MDGSCPSCDTQYLIDELKAVPSVAGATRKGFWNVNQAEDVDEGSCGQSTFGLDVVNLPTGWGKVSYYGDIVTAGTTMHAGSTPSRSFHFALTIPSSAADGNYDMCVLVYNHVSGLQTAKPFRVTLPESGWAWWTNNRPGSYSPAPAFDCSQYVTCRTGIAGCTAPIPKQGICEREAQADEPGFSPNGSPNGSPAAPPSSPPLSLGSPAAPPSSPPLSLAPPDAPGDMGSGEAPSPSHLPPLSPPPSALFVHIKRRKGKVASTALHPPLTSHSM